LGGALGESSWRTPFFAYGFGFVLIPLTSLLLWEPRVRLDRAERAPERAKFVWGRLIWICAITLFTMTAFLITVLQMGFVLTERGLYSPRLIGLWSGLAALANPVGALLFGVLRARTLPKLAASFVLLSVGFFLIALLPGWSSAILGAAIANLGAGMILPTLITWAISTLPAAQRGTGTGLWMAASFLGRDSGLCGGLRPMRPERHGVPARLPTPSGADQGDTTGDLSAYRKTADPLHSAWRRPVFFHGRAGRIAAVTVGRHGGASARDCRGYQGSPASRAGDFRSLGMSTSQRAVGGKALIVVRLLWLSAAYLPPDLSGARIA
jgi:hypothetical protein